MNSVLKSLALSFLLFLISCSSVDFSPQWRNKSYQCSNVNGCAKRIQRVFQHAFQSECEFKKTSREFSFRVILNSDGYIEQIYPGEIGDLELYSCAERTLKSLEPFFEIQSANSEVFKKVKNITFHFKPMLKIKE
jgi:membrane protein involved in colicin uptake